MEKELADRHVPMRREEVKGLKTGRRAGHENHNLAPNRVSDEKELKLCDCVRYEQSLKLLVITSGAL